MSKRILIFNVNWIGDALFSTAVIRNIRYTFPDAYIACVIPPRCSAVLEGNPYLNEVILFNEKGEHYGPWGFWKFTSALRNRKFDTVYLLHRSFTRALICGFAGIKERIGHHTGKRGFLLTRKFIPPAVDSVHRIDYYLDVIKQAGLEVKDRHLDFLVSERDMNAADEFLKKQSLNRDDFLVGLNPGGNWMPKRWPKESFAELADRLADEFKAKVLITGGDKDMPLAREITSLTKHKPAIACGQLNLKQFAGVVRRLDVFITADSGPLHIANAAGAKRIIGLFGPTSPALTGPYPDKNVTVLSKNAGCKIPCYKVDCADNRCMKAITVEDVMEVVKVHSRRNKT
ncbi:MAG: lipopolysaccharide heptosyltransferase II [Candidatus Omnitrophota bacterium]|jgi:lipopolysaccharide heptosyltransferase II